MSEPILKSNQLDLNRLAELSQKPELYAPGEPHFWDDPYIAQQMLQAHLSPHTDAASRKPETIQKTIEWLIRTLPLEQGSKVIDLGCGPGLYALPMAKHGWSVTGVDLSANSIAYARKQAEQAGLPVEYRVQNYLDLTDEAAFDAAMIIYFDLGPLTMPDQKRFLKNVYRALKPGGWFVLDARTEVGRSSQPADDSWYVDQAGFWKPTPHLALNHTFHYPEANVYLDQYLILDEDGQAYVYRVWEHYYSPETITALLAEAGLEVVSIFEDVTGTPFQAQSPSMGIVARKPFQE